MILAQKSSLPFIRLLLITILVLSIIITGCQSKTIPNDSDTESNNTASHEIASPENTTNDVTDDAPITTSNELTDDHLRTLQVNELGDVMILMYHIIGDKEDEWERTKDNLRNDLKILYDDGYYLVTARDFVTGNMDVPAGKTPVVLTFDDGTEGHFRFIEDSQGNLIPDPDSAVGIIETFAKEHPDFGLAATFYVYYPVPFRQNEHPEWRQQKYEYLTNIGMEIGNHTFGHDRLDKLSDEEVQQTLVKHIQSTQTLLSEYTIDTFALTYGIYPKTKELAQSGSYDGMTYHHGGVFLVGSKPTPSPFSHEFNSLGIPRIRTASVPEDYFNQWIEHFRNNPEKRYVSDGDPSTITVPSTMEDLINTGQWEHKTFRTYESSVN